MVKKTEKRREEELIQSDDIISAGTSSLRQCNFSQKPLSARTYPKTLFVLGSQSYFALPLLLH